MKGARAGARDPAPVPQKFGSLRPNNGAGERPPTRGAQPRREWGPRPRRPAGVRGTSPARTAAGGPIWPPAPAPETGRSPILDNRTVFRHLGGSS